MSKPIARLYYYETQSSEWYLTTDKKLASQGLNFRSSSLDDLDDFGCLGGIIDDTIVQVDEGFFEWNPIALVDGFGDTYGDYALVSNLKERVLDRMEYLDMENTIEFKDLVGVSEWKVYSWMDLNEISL
jgi:hypothetical protein